MRQGYRARWVVVLSAALALIGASSAQAGAGDDAHFLVQQQSISNNGSPFSNIVPCPAGERAIGGGLRWFSFPSTLAIRGSGPVDSNGLLLADGEVPAGWQNRATNLGSGSATMISYGICSASTDAMSVKAVDFFVAKDSNGFNTGRSTAVCPNGQRAIGGGVTPLGPGHTAFVMASGPVDETLQVSNTTSGDVAHGWFALINGPLGEVWRVYAICSATSTATIQTSSVVVTAGQGGAAGSTGVSCPTGQRALSGGVLDTAPYAWLIGSAPGGPGSYASSATPGIATGWRGFVWSVVGSNEEFKVAAVCEGPSPGSPPTPPADPGEPAPPVNPAEPGNPGTPENTVSNDFDVGRFYRHKDMGVGAVVLHVPGPGTVTLQSSKFKSQANTASKAEDLGLSVLAKKGPAKDKLFRTGKLKAKVKLTFYPDGGAPSSQKTKLKLIYDG
jgi:hypothetical protein